MTKPFSAEETKFYTRVTALKELIAEQPVHGESCHLLLVQLNHLEVYATSLRLAVMELKSSVQESLKGE